MAEPDEKPLVVIRSLVYNHEPYLRDCLEGFVMQQTTFPFVAVVHDDCSTDGSAAIIREYAEKYPHIIKPIYETENQYSKKDGSLCRVMDEACGKYGAKYFAPCEGDDYWTDPHKLQKQVDFLETHPDYTMVCSDAEVQTPEGLLTEEDFRKIGWPRYHTDKDIPAEDAICLGGWFIHTATIVYVSTLRDDYPEACKRCYTGDHTLQMFAAIKGNVRYIHEKTALYRWRMPGSWTARMTSSIIPETLIPKWKGKMDMFDSLDAYSGGKYRKAFRATQASYALQYIAQSSGFEKKTVAELGYVLKYSYLRTVLPSSCKTVGGRLLHLIKRCCFHPYYPFVSCRHLINPILKPFYHVNWNKAGIKIGPVGVITKVRQGAGKGVYLFGIKIR